MAAYSGAMDHVYAKVTERCPSVFHPSVSRSNDDHTYTAQSITPKKLETSKRQRGTPTGKTPNQPSKMSKPAHGRKSQTPWTNEEKESFTTYVRQTPRKEETLTSYWNRCAEELNVKFPDHCRNGLACKSLSQRMFISPSQHAGENQTTCASVTAVLDTEGGCSLLPTTAEIGTQTDLTLPINSDRCEPKAGDWLYMDQKKDLQGKPLSKGAELLHQTALKRERRYPDISNSEKAYLIDLLSSGSSQQLARGLLTTSVGKVVIKLFINDIEMDARECTNKGTILCQKQYKDLKNFQWENIVGELVSKQSFLCEVLLALALPTEKLFNAKHLETLCPVIGTVYGMLMKQRFKEMCAVQKFITATLANEHTHEKVYDRLQRLGVSLSHNGMLEQMTEISGSFNEELINTVVSGKRFRIVGDNVNFQVGVAQERKSLGKQTHMEHWFGSAAIIQNTDFSHLSNITPQQDLRQMPCESFILSQQEMNHIVLDFTMFSAQILVEHFPWLKFAKAAVTENLYEMPEGMNQRNKVIPLPVLHKNEQKYADVVDILDSYQEQCEFIYNAAEKPLPNIHIGGDQLTRERFSGAKMLRAAALTETERLTNLDPITFELFHLQMAVLTAFYQNLYDTQNTESFTLYSQKVRLVRKDADGKDVKNHYDSCKDLAESVIKSFIVEAACEHIGLANTDVIPDNIPDCSQLSSGEIRNWIIEQFSPVLLNVTSVTRKFLFGANVEHVTDGVNTYANVVIELGLIYMELCNIVKTPNRDRLLRLMKYIMIVLKGHNNRSKYALEILRLLCKQFAILSEQTAHETMYGLFTNTGKSIIPVDLQMEYLVRLTKTHLRSMCSNVTEKSLKKRSSAFFGMNEISEHFDSETSTLIRAQKHKRLSSLEDEKRIIETLRAVRPFMTVPGRKICTQKKDTKNPITKLDMEAFKHWIEKHKVNLIYQL